VKRWALPHRRRAGTTAAPRRSPASRQGHRPSMLLQMIAIVLVMVFPEIALWLPRVLAGG
jgi:TRAP-type mannitol/chloroaromatic compound transport system permease large subunit